MQHPEPALRVLVLGDSLAAGTGDETGRGIAGHLPGVARRPLAARTLGTRGATTADLAAQLRQPRVREALADADVVVLSIGANDLLRSPEIRERLFSSPLRVGDEILERVAARVAELRALRADARILVLGAYNPAPRHRLAPMVEPLIAAWDGRLARRFAADPRVDVVRIADVVDRPERLSRLDGFHPGEEAYRETARRIAAMLDAAPRAA